MYKSPSLFRDGDFFRNLQLNLSVVHVLCPVRAIQKDDCIERKAYGNS